RVLTEACACRTHTRRALPTRRASDLIGAGRAVAIGESLSLTPQAQLSYSKVDFDGFADRFGAAVGLDRSEALQGRLGLSLDHKRQWTGQDGRPAQSHVYGLANLFYGFDAETEATVAGVAVSAA